MPSRAFHRQTSKSLRVRWYISLLCWLSVWKYVLDDELAVWSEIGYYLQSSDLTHGRSLWAIVKAKNSYSSNNDLQAALRDCLNSYIVWMEMSRRQSRKSRIRATGERTQMAVDVTRNLRWNFGRSLSKNPEVFEVMWFLNPFSKFCPK